MVGEDEGKYDQGPLVVVDSALDFSSLSWTLILSSGQEMKCARESADMWCGVVLVCPTRIT
jgi:hypothetical protein